jgi:hypothetical protein
MKENAPANLDFDRLLERMTDVTQDIVFFPVRHHSPVCAAMIKKLIEQLQPSAVLIEGPSDYNEHLDELSLDHQLPIAIYSYFRTEGGLGGGAYYPFCDYSPEWVAMQSARDIQTQIAFIDLPWIETAHLDRTTHRYADAELRRGRYIQTLCRRMQVDDFDELWDRLVESDWSLDLPGFLRRVHALCLHIRFGEASISQSDLLRETYMLEQIRQTRERVDGSIVVVTGGFHSSALAAPFAGIELDEPAAPIASLPEAASVNVMQAVPTTRGISLTTYSYERLDNLVGYNSGMPNPGFYDWAWQCRSQGNEFSYHPLLADLIQELRKRKQGVSTADLIAIETSARGLAAMRGRDRVWRNDLIDAVTTALVKDELQYDCASPFLDAVHAVLRGSRRGRLAAGTRMPPLVEDIRQQMEELGLELKRSATLIHLELQEAHDLQSSRLLHQLRLLQIGGIKLVDGTNFLDRADMSRLWEKWELRWTPEFDSSSIEASRYGTTLADATAARLTEHAQSTHFSAADAAKLLVDGCRSGMETLSPDLLEKLDAMIAQESDFTIASEALRHLTWLYCHDEIFGTQRTKPIEQLLAECFTRSLWLLDALGQSLPSEQQTIAGLRTLQEVALRAKNVLAENLDDLRRTFSRIQNDTGKHPAVRGAVVGILWNLGGAEPESILQLLLGFSKPDDLGSFLAGLFALAREIAQRHPQLVQTVDRLLMELAGEGFQHALPSLRLAFTYFTPREKHYMLTTLFQSLGIHEIQSLPQLSVTPELAAEALAIEERIFAAIDKYSLGETDA